MGFRTFSPFVRWRAILATLEERDCCGAIERKMRRLCHGKRRSAGRASHARVSVAGTHFHEGRFAMAKVEVLNDELRTIRDAMRELNRMVEALEEESSERFV
jgi:hypothetical protein